MRSLRALVKGLAIGLGVGAVHLLDLPVLADAGSPPAIPGGAVVGAQSPGSSPASSATAVARDTRSTQPTDLVDAAETELPKVVKDIAKANDAKDTQGLEGIQGTKTAKTGTAKTAKTADGALTMDGFLDRLMIAESGGNDQAKNPLSTATGAYQFIEATFLAVMRRHFPERIVKLDAGQILALRSDRTVAREAARAFTKDNATHLAAAGHKPTFPHLRLAFLLGAGGASEVLSAKPEAPLSGIVGPAVIRANPWMARYTAADLVRRAARDVAMSPTSLAGIEPRRDPRTGELIAPKSVASRPRIAVRCNLARPSCRRWLSLKRAKLGRRKAAKVARSKR